MATSQSAAPNGISISFPGSGARRSARYVSATTVCEEGLLDGRWIGLYWSAGGQVQRENVVSQLPGLNPAEYPLHAFDLEIDGQDLRNRWNWLGASQRAGQRPGTAEAVVELAHQVRPITVRIVTRLDGTPFLVRWLEITNTGSAPAALSRVSPWSGMLWAMKGPHEWGDSADPHSPVSLGYFRGLTNGTEGDFAWEPLPLGTRRIEGTIGRSGHGNPFFMLRNECLGQTAIGSLAYSGNWFMEFWRDPMLTAAGTPARGINLAFKIGPLGPAPLRVLAPGETVSTPLMHLAMLQAGLDDCVSALHEHVRTSVIPARPRGKEFFVTVGRVVEEPGPWILKEMDIAAEMGADAFMVDAGWYGDTFASWWGQRGDWNVGDWIPGGLAECRRHCRQLGMQFGLWMEPEAVGPDSRLLREHPDWLPRIDDVHPAAGTLDLSHPDAAAYMSREVLRVIQEHQPDFFKLDYNIGVNEGGQRQRDGWVEHESWRHYEVIYELFDEVRRRFPDLAMENCASGGGRNDLGMLARFHYTAISDYSMFPRSIRAINGLTLFLPPESLCYYHNHMHVAHQRAGLDTHLRVTLFAQTVFIGFGAQDADRSTAYFDTTRRYIRLAKEFVAPILSSGAIVYHHTPSIGLSGPADWCVLEYASPDRARGYVGVFKLAVGHSDYRLMPKGIDRGVEYQVTLDNKNETFRVSGRELADQGLNIPLDAAMTSELVMYQRAR